MAYDGEGVWLIKLYSRHLLLIRTYTIDIRFSNAYIHTPKGNLISTHIVYVHVYIIMFMCVCVVLV